MDAPAIRRVLQDRLDREGLRPNRVLLLLGPRRVGKTQFIRDYLATYKGTYLLLNGEDATSQAQLEPVAISNYQRLLAGISLLVVDEAQAVPDIGRKLKLIVDEVSGIRVLATGSSALSLRNDTGEPLTGRVQTRLLYPICQQELMPRENLLQVAQRLPDRLVYGSYPELFSLATPAQQAEYLAELVSSYLLKDILMQEVIRNPTQMLRLLQLVAYQIGKEVSPHELAGGLQLSYHTVQRYLDLLEQVFVLRRVGGYSTGNLRKEITKTSRYYFLDNGIQNAVIGDFRALGLRQGSEVGQLWENYLATERLKYLAYNQIAGEVHFWRTYDQQEIDWVEAAPGQLAGYEFKYSKPRRTKPPGAWAKAYPDAGYQIISPENYLDFILPQ